MSWLRDRHIRVSLAQMTVVQGDRARNLETARAFIEEAAQAGAALIVLPETFATGINLTDLHACAERLDDGPVSAFLAAQARSHRVYLAAGVLEKHGRDIYDSVVLTDPAGEPVAVYRRWFLWQMEKDFLAPGHPSQPIDTPLGRIGFICGYDLNFPEACRGLFRGQTDLIVCLTAVFDMLSYPVRGLCRSRAFDNHCYFALCGCLGRHEFANCRFAGCSVITCDPLFTVYEDKEYDPERPDVIAEADSREQVLTADLNLQLMARRRGKVPQYGDLEFALQTKEGVAA